jgi:histidinol-phosphate aminotransferase
MQRRDLLKQTALTLAAFSFSRDLFAAEADKFVQSPYADKIIKLSSNENPHGPSPAARKQMMDAVNGSNRYPWDVTTKLREEIGALTGHTKEHIVIGAGSSELLGLTAVWAALQKGNAVAPDPTFRLWMPAARRTGLSIKLVPLNAKKETDLQRMKEAMTTDTKLVYLCNPGNPTGTIIPAKDLELFIKEIAPKAIILLDEAYTEFSNEPSMAHLVNDYPNLVIAKTFSKIYGMAGARVGYILAHPSTVKQLNELQPWANAGASAVSLAGALAAIKDKAFIDYCKKENAAAKAIFCKALEKAGIPYIPSHTSFVYFDTTNFGKDLKAMLEAKGIVGARTFEEGTKWLRLSIGTQDEMKQAAAAILA